MRQMIMVLLLLLFSGCSYFVPGDIKREASLTRIDLQTACGEAPPLQKEADERMKEADELFGKGQWQQAASKYKEAATKSGEATSKMLRSYRRVLPHAVNLDDYMNRRPSEKDDEKEKDSR